MKRQGEDALVSVEDLSRTVTLMDVQVQNEDSIDPWTTQSDFSANSQVVEDTVSGSFTEESVMRPTRHVARKRRTFEHDRQARPRLLRPDEGFWV